MSNVEVVERPIWVSGFHVLLRRLWVARTHSGAGKAAAGRRPQSVRGRPQVRLNWGTLRLQALKLKLHRVMDSAVVEQNVLELAVMPANGK